MNRPLLLLVCDFLLLSMFAMARFDVPADAIIVNPDKVIQEPKDDSGDMSGLVKTLQESLALEKMENEQKTLSLKKANENLALSNQQLDQLKSDYELVKEDANQFAEEKNQKEIEIKNLQKSLERTQSSMTQFKALTQREKAELQGLLIQKQQDFIINETKLKEAEMAVQQKENLLSAAIREQAMLEQRLIDAEANVKFAIDRNKKLEEESTQLSRRTQLLDSTIDVLQSEKKLISSNLQQTKEFLSQERELNQKLQNQAASLTSSVASLANKSDEITKEIRRSSPMSPHEIFNDFLNRSVQLHFEYSSRGIVGNLVEKEKRIPSILFQTDGSNRIYTMCHIYDTPFEVKYRVNTPIDIKLFMKYGGVKVEVSEIGLLKGNSHFVVAEIKVAQEDFAMLPEVYKFSNDPFQYPEVVVVQSENEKYGVSPYSIIPGNMKSIRLKNGSVISSLLGDFKSSRGNFLFSQGGEFLGLLHDGNESMLLDSMDFLKTIKLGSNFDSQRVKSDLDSIFRISKSRDNTFPRTISP